MDVEFKNKNLDRLEVEAEFTDNHDAVVVSAFRKRMQQIRNAPDERIFRAMQSLHFEKLKGSRSHQYSMRLNDQWRLVLELKGKGGDKVVVVIGIEDYH
jgi:toxin HigB-1